METLQQNCLLRKNPGTLFNPTRGLALRAPCKSWRCSRCGPYQGRKVAARFEKGNWHKLITITLPPGRGWPKRENFKYLSRRVHKFLELTRRVYPLKAVGWVREITEPHAGCVCEPSLPDCLCGANGNRLHLHMLVEFQPWMDNYFLKGIAAKVGLGFIDVRAVRGDGAIRYVTKYLVKGVGSPFPRSVRRYRCDVPRPEPEPGWLFTWYDPATVAKYFYGELIAEDATFYSTGVG